MCTVSIEGSTAREGRYYGTQGRDYLHTATEATQLGFQGNYLSGTTDIFKLRAMCDGPPAEQYAGPPAEHSDSSAPNTAPDEGEYRAPTWYEPFPEKDGYDPDTRKYGAVEQRAFDIQVSSPVDDVETLLHRTHLTAQFHVENQDYWEKETPYTNDGGMLYDLAVLDLFEKKLKCEGIEPSETNIPERRLKTLFLREAREQSGTELYEYLKGSNPIQLAVHTELGYDGPGDIPSYDTLQREFRKLREEEPTQIDAFDAAVTRTVYSVYRAGIIPPDAVRGAYNFDAVEPPLDEKSVPREVKKDELRNFVEELLHRTTVPLTFGREDDETQHHMNAFIGAFAASALFDCGLENLKDVCDWNYPRDQIPSGGWAHNYISDRLRHDEDLADFEPGSESGPLPSINEQFNAVHRRTLTLAHTLGFWSESDPLNLGVDLFRVDWTGDSLDATIGRPPKADNEAVTEQWTFVLAGGIDTESRFVLGGRWIATLRDYPDSLCEILSNLSNIVDIDAILIDGEIVSGSLIETLRRFAGDDWIINAPDKAVIKGLRRLTPKNYAGFARNVKWNVHPKPNAVTYPYDGDDPAAVEVNPDNVLADEIRNEDDRDKIDIPLDNRGNQSVMAQSPLVDKETIPQLTEAITDLESQPGVGNGKSHASYLTDRSLPERTAASIRFSYIQRWSIEATVNQITNNFMPKINSKDPKQRLFGVHIAILFYNWHTLINRCLSPQGLRLDITYQELLQAIQDVGFSAASNDNN